MKISISMPDSLVRKIDHLAQRSRRSRNELFRAAVAEYVMRHACAEVTDAMDRICRDAGADPDAFVATVGRRVLREVEW
jgi:predicted transcriptional regulator